MRQNMGQKTPKTDTFYAVEVARILDNLLLATGNISELWGGCNKTRTCHFLFRKELLKYAEILTRTKSLWILVPF